MANFMDKIMIRRRHLIVDEQDVLHVLSVIQSYHSVVPEMNVGNCGWTDSNKWFIHFDCSDAKWRLLRRDLMVVRVFENTDIPKSNLGVVYSKD